MKKSINLGLSLLIIVGVITVLTLPLIAHADFKGVIKIGQTCSLAKSIHVLGIAERDGARIACEEINKQGGVLGRKLEFIFRDNEGSPEKAVTQAKELCMKDRIDFAFGPILSSNARAVSAVYQRYKVPTLLLGSMANEVMTMGNPYYMRLCNSAAVCGNAMAQAVGQGGFKRPAIIYLNDFFGNSLRKVMHSEVGKMGLKIVSEANFDMGAVDMSPQAMRILAANPDIIILVAYSGDAANFLRTAKAQGYKGEFVGYSALVGNSVRKAAGHDVDGVVFPIGGHAQGFYGWDRPGFLPLMLKLEAAKPMGKFETVNASPEIDILDGYSGVMTLKKYIEAAGERGLKDKEYFMEVASKMVVHNTAFDVFFPWGRKKMENMTVDRLVFGTYDNGHTRLWKHEPTCIETFEATRNQAEEEIYSQPFEEGVSYKKYMQRWQELLKQNKDKIEEEVYQKVEDGNMRGEDAIKFRTAFNDILNYKIN